MTSDDIDRILASEEPLFPSSGFVASVMAHLGEDGAEPPPLPFPWRRFLLGLLGTLALSAICGWTAVALHVPAALEAALSDPHLSLALAGAGLSLAGTYLLVRLTLGLTEVRS